MIIIHDLLLYVTYALSFFNILYICRSAFGSYIYSLFNSFFSPILGTNVIPFQVRNTVVPSQNNKGLYLIFINPLI